MDTDIFIHCGSGKPLLEKLYKKYVINAGVNMDKLIIENLKYLNDSVLSILFLMPVTLIIVFEVFDNDPSLKYLSFATGGIFILGIWYTTYRLYSLHQRLLRQIESAESNSSSSE